MAAINAFQALSSYQSYNNMFSLAKKITSSDGPIKPLSYSFARFASLQFATTSARGLSDILASANQLKHTLASFQLKKPASLSGGKDAGLSLKPDSNMIVKKTKQLVTDYNSLHTAISDKSGYLKPEVKSSLQNSLNSDALKTLGLAKNADNTLYLNEDSLKNNIKNNYVQVDRSLNGSNGIVSALGKFVDKLQSSPSKTLLNTDNSEYKRYNNYQSSKQLYSQLPTTGLLLDNNL